MKTVLIIEPDNGFILRLTKTLRDERLDSEFEIIQITPDISSDHNMAIKSAIEQVQSYHNIFGIFVDIEIIEGDSWPGGIEITATLRKLYPKLPIFNITNKHEKEKDFDNLSWATLEEVDGVLVKSFLYGISNIGFKRLFEKALEKRQKVFIQDIESHLELIQTVQNTKVDISILTALMEDEYQICKKRMKGQENKHVFIGKFENSDDQIALLSQQ